jgi:hypothetical protein
LGAIRKSPAQSTSRKDEDMDTKGKTNAEVIRHIQEKRFEYLSKAGKIPEKTVEEWIAKCKEVNHGSHS